MIYWMSSRSRTILCVKTHIFEIIPSGLENIDWKAPHGEQHHINTLCGAMLMEPCYWPVDPSMFSIWCFTTKY